MHFEPLCEFSLMYFEPCGWKMQNTVNRENFAPVLFSPFSPSNLRGEFKTGLIELYIKEYVRKLESGRIQDWANRSQISIGRK